MKKKYNLTTLIRMGLIFIFCSSFVDSILDTFSEKDDIFTLSYYQLKGKVKYVSTKEYNEKEELETEIKINFNKNGIANDYSFYYGEDLARRYEYRNNRKMLLIYNYGSRFSAIDTVIYDDKYNIVERVMYYQDGINMRRIFEDNTYRKDGTRSEMKRRIYNKGELESLVTHKFNEQGKVIQEASNSGKETTIHKEYKYKKGKLIEENRFLHDYSIEKISYEYEKDDMCKSFITQKMITGESFRYESHDPNKITTYRYNKGKIILYAICDLKGDTLHKETISYDRRGNPSQANRRSYRNDYYCNNTYEYIYDKKGNWTEKILTNDTGSGRYISTYKRKIVYY